MTHPAGKYATGFHRNAEPDGPCHYYRLRNGQRILLRASEIEDVDPTPLGAVVRTKGGTEYKVTSPKPESIVT